MAEEEIERPIANEGQSESSNPLKVSSASGRLTFMGFDMVFLVVNGNEMFTLHEILQNIFPNTPRTTVCSRLVRMKAIRHLCSKEEVKTLKALGGVRSCAMNCCMIARQDIERTVRYFEKHTKQDKAIDSGTSVSDDNVITLSGDPTLNQVGEDTEHTTLSTTNLKCRNDEDACHEHSSEDSKANVLADIEKLNSANPKISNISDGLCVCDEDILHEEKTLSEVGQTAGDVLIHKQTENPPVNKKVPKTRKRRTQLEILESYNGEISCGILDNKRQRKGSRRYAGDEKIWELETTIKRLSAEDFIHSSKCLDLPCRDVEDVYSDKEVVGLDNNNNNVQPTSPKFLLKRLVNNDNVNEWRIASSVSRLSFDDEDQTTASPDHLESLGSSSPTHGISTNTLSSTQGEAEGAVQKSAKGSTKIKFPLASQKKKNGNKVGICKSMKNMKRKRRPNQVRRTVTDIEAITEVQMADFQRDENIQAATSGTLNGLFTTSTSGSKNKDLKITPARRRTPVKEQSAIGCEKSNINKSVDINEEGSIKPKRRRRVQRNPFRLVETLPYPSLLKVKDGDLYPTYTMIYSSGKSDPGCCHPLWRWRLGKPILPPKQSRMIASPAKQPESKSDICKEFQFPVLIKDDNLLLKDNIINSPDNVNSMV